MNQFTLNIFTPTIKLVHEVHYNLGYIYKIVYIKYPYDGFEYSKRGKCHLLTYGFSC